MSDQSTPNHSSLLHRLFLAHPETVNESYFQHMRFAFGFSFWLALAAGAALLHAILPFLFETTASGIIEKLVARMDARH